MRGVLSAGGCPAGDATPDSLLDEFVDALAAGDAGGIACVDKVIEVGQDPRRFAEDLLVAAPGPVIVAAVPDALTACRCGC